MSRDSAVSVPSGTVAFLIDYNPTLANNIPRGTYPTPSHRDELRVRTGENVVVLNPQDFSAFAGIKNQAISVTASAVPLPFPALEGRRGLLLTNLGPDTCFIGASGVTTANGTPLLLNNQIGFDLQNNIHVTIYGISAGTSDIRILELS